jgi:hypothetical protein
VGFPQAAKNTHNDMHQKDISRRDEYRSKRELPPKRADLSFTLAGKAWKRISFNRKQKVRATKHTYDWTWHGCNQAKPSNITLPSPLCGLPDTQYHMFMKCTYPNIIITKSQILQDKTKEITD